MLPTRPAIPRRTDFAFITDALDYVADAGTGLTFHGARGEPLAELGYGALSARSKDLARRLHGLPLEPGDRVGLIGETSPQFVTAFFACIRAGLVPVPLPVPGVFSDAERYTGQVRRQLASCGARLLLRPEGPPLLGGARRAGALERSWRELAEAPPADRPAFRPAPDALCYLQFSSGSTRFPTGVAISHDALMQNCRAIALHGAGVEADDRVVSWLPLYHDMGLVGVLLASVAAGVSIDLMATENFVRRPLIWLELISRNRATISAAPCFGYGLCIRRARSFEHLDLSSWRIAGVGAELIDPQVMKRFAETFAAAGFRRRSVVASYGLAEATLAVTFAAPDRGLVTETVDRAALGIHSHASLTADDGRSFVRCGRPLPGQRVEIRDASGAVLKPRSVGRIFVRGPSVMQGYFGDAAATDAVLHRGWLDTGDIGYLADGELVVVGRAKDTIIVNGRNIWPQDLESIVEALPGVRSQDAAAFGVHEKGEGERPVVLIQCRLRHPSERATLAAAAHRSLAEATGISCRVVLVPPHSLPRTSSGKLNRSLARQRYREGAYGWEGLEQEPTADALPLAAAGR